VDNIKGGNLVRLKSTEQGGYLSGDNYYNQNADVCVRIYKGEYEEEHKCVDNVWEIEFDRNFSRGDQCHLIDQYQSREKDRIVTQTYRLRHFRTGRILSFKDYFDPIDMKLIKRPILA
jgi:hypothetical protein